MSTPNPDHSSSDPAARDSLLTKQTHEAPSSAKRVKNIEEQSDDNYYLSGLFNLTTSPIFKYMDSLSANHAEISDELVAKYKDKFTQLHEFLLKCSNYEKVMGKKLKALAKEVTMQRMEKDRAVSKQFSGNAEIGEIRRELLKAQNEVNLALERESKLAKDYDEAVLQKQDLVHDIEEIRRRKADMLEPQLLSATKELKVDLIQRKHQSENLSKDLEEKQILYDVVLVERDRMEAEKEKNLLALSKSCEAPLKIAKQLQVLKDAISSLSGEQQKQVALVSQLDKEIERLTRKKRELEENRLALSLEFEDKRGLIHSMEKQVDDIFKDHELAKEELAFQKSEKTRIEQTLKRIVFDIKREHDLVLRVIREKETQLKLFRRLEMTVNNIKLSTPTARKQSHELARHLQTAKNDLVYYKKENARLLQTIDIATFDFVKQDTIEKKTSKKLQDTLAANKRKKEELEKTQAASVEISRQLNTVKMEKDLVAREYIRISSKQRQVKAELGAKEIIIVDASKRATEACDRVVQFGQLYELVKNERNKYLNLFQSSTQRGMELKEKIKILSNEIEILRFEINRVDRECSRKIQENSSNYAARDSAKNEANKAMVQYRSRRDLITQNQSTIELLNCNINLAEEAMQQLKIRYERAIKERNSTGVHLLDRNDELCILYERLNVQKQFLAKGESCLVERNEEIRKLMIIFQQFKHGNQLKQDKLPVIAKLQSEVEALEAKRKALQRETLKLGKSMEDPNEKERLRNLGGIDPDKDALVKKINALQDSLALKQEVLLEKDLLLEEVGTLTNRLKIQTMKDGELSEATGKQLNSLKRKIKVITRKMMAKVTYLDKVSELSMLQSLATKLHQEKCEKEALLEDQRQRLETKNIPNEEIQQDFIRYERKKLQKQQLLANDGKPMDMLEDDCYLVGDIRTHAEPRPNAYIPDGVGYGELSIPKPYGQHAPFKPQGTAIRYYKKSVEKEIVL